MITISDDNKGPKWVIEGLHGRQEELNLLNEIAYKAESACILLDGCEGSGKATLVKSVNWDDKGWVFVSRKFERHLSSEPYSALTRAVDELVEIWCKNNEKFPDNCKMSELLDVLENDMELLQNVIPGLFRAVDKFSQRMYKSSSQRKLFRTPVTPRNNNDEADDKPTPIKKNFSRRNLMMKAQSTSYISRSRAMLQKSPSIKDLTSSRRQRNENGISGSSARRQRGKMGNERMGGDSAAIAGAFLKLFSFLSSTKPVVLSFEDVHFADSSSMEILKLIANTAANTPDKMNILLLLSYTELLEENKFVAKGIKKIKALTKNVHYLPIQNWDVESVSKFVASLTKAEPAESLPVAEVIHKKTGGNPFEVIQFLRFAREQGHFKFSSMTYRWQCEDVEELDQCASVSDNVAEILAASMVRLPYATKSALKVASCLGYTIPLDVLVVYFSENNKEEAKQTAHEDKMVELLDAATKEGLLVKSESEGAYMWSNGKLQQAAYESMTPTMRNRLHLTLGRLLWELGMIRDLEWMIFMAATQMNKYAESQADASLGNEVAELNLQAAILSLNKGAIYPALEFLEKAQEHMEVADGWSEAYEMTHDILTTLAETKLRVGEIESAMKIASEVVQNSDSHEDTFPAHLIMLECLVSGNDRDYERGVEKTLWLLKYYGERSTWRFYPGQETVEKKKLKSKIKKYLPGGAIENILDLSDMVDVAALRIQTLLVNHLAVYASYCPEYKAISWFASARALKSAVKRGISPVTNLAIVQLASHLRVEGKFNKASKYAEVALTLTECLPRSLGSDHGQVRMIACGSVFSAVRSFNKCLNELLECRSDFLRAGLAKQSIAVAIGYTITYLCVGLSLPAAKSDLEQHTQDARQYGCPYAVEQKMRILHQTIINLTDKVSMPSELSGDIMDQEEELQKVEGLGALRIRLGMDACRLMLCCVYCDWVAAEYLIDDLEENGDEQDGFLMRSHFRRCYVGLAAFAVSRSIEDPKDQKHYYSIGKKMLASFTKEMKYGSVNAFPIVTMLEAEKNPSKESYDKAIKACARLGLVHHEAYMCERTAELFRKKNDVEWVKHYISEAILLYGEWGAGGKVDKLLTDYGDVLQGSSIRDSVNTSLQSRCRYSAKELVNLRRIDWKNLKKHSEDESANDFTFGRDDASFASSMSLASR